MAYRAGEAGERCGLPASAAKVVLTGGHLQPCSGLPRGKKQPAGEEHGWLRLLSGARPCP